MIMKSSFHVLPYFSSVLQLGFSPVVLLDIIAISSEDKPFPPAQVTRPPRHPIHSMSIRIQLMNERYSSSGNLLGECIVFWKWSNPVAIIPAHGWFYIEDETNFSVMCGEYGRFCGNELFRPIPWWLIKSIGVHWFAPVAR